MHAIAPIARVNLNITAFCMNDDSSLAAPPSHSLSGPFFVTQDCKLHAAISRGIPVRVKEFYFAS